LDEQKLGELKKLIQENAIVVDASGGEGITLSSGIKSPFYYDLKKITFDPVGLSLITDLLYDEIVQLGVKSVGGLEIGAIPLTTAILMKDAQEGGGKLKGFVVRKKPKEHGLKYAVEGELRSPAIMVDDVLTTGASLKVAIDAVTSKGVLIRHVFCILDRQHENNELKKNHYKYHSLFVHADFKDFIDKKLLINKLVRNLAN